MIKGGTDKPTWNLWREGKDEEEEEQKQKVETQGWLDGEVNRWRAVFSLREKCKFSREAAEVPDPASICQHTHIHMQAINAPDWLKIYSV